jgi:hypothetical protein
VVKQDGEPRPIQFSGGEPTVRDDLPALVEAAREMGFEHVQVNTNGLRLANESGYAERLADAGVTAIYLQFDGLEPETYEAIREVDIADEKRAAVEACREAGIKVLLVPTVVPGVNDHEMGAIVEFGLENIDVISAINFQPVAHFGRYDTHDGRFALDDAARTLAEQVEALEARDMYPIPCCSSYCQMATALTTSEDGGEPLPLTALIDEEAFANLSGFVDEADWMEWLASTPAGSDRACDAVGCCGLDLGDVAPDFIETVLPISVTGFMDADAADVDRLENCCISVPTPDGELVPFCGYNMTTDDGAYELRNRYDWGGRSDVDVPLPDPPEEAGADGDHASGSIEADGRGDGGSCGCGTDCGSQ